MQVNICRIINLNCKEIVEDGGFSHLRDQLGVGLIAQLLEHFTGITERVMGSNPVQA